MAASDSASPPKRAPAAGRGPADERRLSIRLSWPYARVAGSDREELAILEREGIGMAEFADPDTRLRHRVVIELLEHAVRRTGDPALGLRAAEQLEPGDLDVLEHVARTCSTLREAIECWARYACLMNEAADVSIEEGPELAKVCWRINDGVPQPAAANDFVTASTLALWRRLTGVERLAVEIHFTHARATDPAAYARVFGVPLRFGMPYNATLVRRETLELPLLRADRGLHAAYELHARTLLERLRGQDGVAARARELVVSQLSHGDVGMESVARKLAMSVATLRRRLDEAGTSHREIVDRERHQLALRYLQDPRLATSEVAFLLGFSHVTALHKAFKRWTGGLTPAEYRARSQAASADPKQPA
jgi:AraC-like DNA-binding protein